MAQKRVIEILDDLDGTSDATPREFSVGGVSYEIDLSDENYEKLMSRLSSFIAVARKTKSASRRGQQSPKANREELTKIREWARTNGYEVSGRGRVAQPILEAYAAANA
ncbi:histone-like nucleoid-structuring protein Lsr2 [Paenarthrobacter nitroguajacolicus]|uniref:histone-like nucleoid-structuring protein Lsr2 n=1 Tax=Paenarthrobacter nitroguajacolicus TaxID=211146 RepID=UPI0015B7C00B|nr:hypothetical protein [Paenarthrobacter nitroguajacolicus]